MEESKGPSSSDVGAVNANFRAQPSESTDDQDDLFQSHPANLECSGTECRKREEELKGKLEKSINDGRSNTAYIQLLLNKKKESDRKIRYLALAYTKHLKLKDEELKLKEEELKFAQGKTDVAKAKYKELEKTNTDLNDELGICWSIVGEVEAECKELEEQLSEEMKRNADLEKELDLYQSIIDKDFADGEQQCVEANFASAIGELDIDVPQPLKEGSLSQEWTTSDEEQKCHLLNRLKCPVSCVPTVFYNILEESGDEMCDIMLIKEVQRQLDAKLQPVAKPSEIMLSTCSYYHRELIELDLIVEVFSKPNIHSEDERKEALEEAFKKMEDEDARGLLLVYKKDDIGHCVQITPRRFQSASAGKTDFFDVQKNKPWPECAENFNSIHTLIVFKINKDMLEIFKRPCGRRNCVRAKHRALPAKQLTK